MIGVLIQPAEEEELDVQSNDSNPSPAAASDADPASSSSDENTEYDSFLTKSDSNQQVITSQQFRRRRQTPRDMMMVDGAELGPGLGQYDDFHTIDWQRDVARDRNRHRSILKKKDESFFNFFRATHDAWSGWLCVSLVGITAGAVAGAIDIGAGWMKDLKEGICQDVFYLNREQCCWSSNDTVFEGYHCKQWKTWPQILGLEDRETFGYFTISYFMYLMWSLFFAFLAVMLVKTFAPYACGSGIPETKTILSGFIIHGFLGKWTLIIKAVGVMLAVAAGLSLGKEGPLVHVCCCIGNIFSYLFPKYGKNEAKKREILSAASAAGVSVAFGAPIGGVLFSLEEVSYYFPLKTMWRSFFCALVAAFVLRSINPFGNEHLVMFYVGNSRPWILFELVPFLIIGMGGGIIGAIFIKFNIKWCQRRKSSNLGRHPIFEVITITAVTALIAFPNEYTRMNSSDLIKLLFSQCGIADVHDLCDYKRNYTMMIANKKMSIAEAGPGVHKSILLLMLALVFKLVITIFTFGIKVPAGLFIPSMAMGAIMGRVIGITMEQIAFNYPGWWIFQGTCSAGENCMTPGLYAMVGAAATLGGVTRMTVSLVVIMFELTGSVNWIVPLMVSVMAAKWVGDSIVKQGVYDAHIGLNGYPFLDAKEDFVYTTIAADVMSPKKGEAALAVLTQNSMSVVCVEKLLKTSNHNGYPVIVSEESQYLVGFVLRKDLIIALTSAKEAMEVFENTKVVFNDPRNSQSWTSRGPPPINLKRIVDFSPVTITDQTPMEMVVDMFRKLGLRHVLVTHNGRLLGIITKKDVLVHVKKLSKEEDKAFFG